MLSLGVVAPWYRTATRWCWVKPTRKRVICFAFPLFSLLLILFISYELTVPQPRQVHISLTNAPDHINIKWYVMDAWYFIISLHLQGLPTTGPELNRSYNGAQIITRYQKKPLARARYTHMIPTRVVRSIQSPSRLWMQDRPIFIAAAILPLGYATIIW